jgi:hypothetical protein
MPRYDRSPAPHFEATNALGETPARNLQPTPRR